MFFRRLRVKLTVLYAGLFGLALVFIGVSACLVVERNAESQVRQELDRTSAMFARYWDVRLRQLNAATSHYAEDHALDTAMVERTDNLIAFRLAEIRRHTATELAFVVTPEGLVISEGGARTSVPPGLQMALQSGRVTPGLLTIGEDLYQATALPLPDGNAWLITGDLLNAESTADLRQLTSIPVEIEVSSRRNGRWTSSAVHADAETMSSLAGRALAEDEPISRRVPTESGQALVTLSEIPSLDGTEAVLIVRTQASSGLAPYTALLGILKGSPAPSAP
jgi:hypothetical protein